MMRAKEKFFFILFLLLFLLLQSFFVFGAIKPQIEAGWAHSVAIISNGTLWTWGYNNYGQLGKGVTSTTIVPSPQKIGSANNWSSFSSGYGHTVALKSDGTLWTWGWNAFGQLGNGSWNNAGLWNAPEQIGIETNWASVSAGRQHSIAVKSDGNVWSWGVNAAGELGVGNNTGPDVCASSTKCSTNPVQVDLLTNVKSIATGRRHSLALKSNGELWAWGYNLYGQIGNSTKADSYLPVQVPISSDVVSIAAGEYHSLALTSDGKLLAWGRNNFGQLGTNATTADNYLPLPVKMQNGEDFTDVVAISAGEGHSLALKGDGSLWAWGHNDEGQFGDGTTTNSIYPKQIGTSYDWISISGGGDYTGSDTSIAHTIALRSDGNIWTWGSDTYGQLGNDESGGNPILQLGLSSDWLIASGGGAHSVGIKADGSLKSWGNNVYGQLGKGTTGGIYNSGIPSQATGMYNAVSVSSGGAHSAALISNGTIWTWGDNTYGKLGNGSTGGVYNSPALVSAILNATSIKAGQNHTAALISNGTVWTWGDNTDGQLGDGTNDPKNEPNKIVLLNAISISTGANHTAALISNGTVRTWGRNEFGQLGDGTTNNTNTPVQAAGVANAVSVSAGGSHTAALISNGTLMAWGDNQYGQLGKTGILNSLTPVSIGIYNVTALATGKEHTVALKSNGTLWAWGRNNYGQIGNGTTADPYYDTPVQVGTDNTWVWVGAGDYHSIARKADGKLYAWGRNSSGELGDGTTTDRSSPVLVGVNTPPTANNDSASTNEDTPVSISVLSNDTDPDGDTLSISAYGQGSNGSVTQSGQNLIYTPNLNYYGSDSFTYTASDGKGGTSDATVDVTINADNDAPVASDGNLTTAEDTQGSGTLSATDVDSGSFTYSIVVNGSKGTAVVTNSTTGAYTYTPISNATGADSFTFKANDGFLDSNTATISITINADNDAPVASDGNLTTDEDTPGSGTLSATDVDSGSFTYSIVSNGSKGTAVVTNSTTGAYTYTPISNATGADSFTFKANDGFLDSNTATISITINAINDAPTDISLSSSSIAENQSSGTTIGELSATDPDAGDSHAYALVSGDGSTDNTSFSITGTTLKTAAVFDYETKDSYSIRVRATDSGTGSLTYEKIFSISVTDVNEAPTDISLTVSSIAENQSSGTTVGTLSATDADTGDTHTFALVAGTGDTDNASFTITGTSLKTAAVFDYETKNSYSIRVSATDSGTGSLTYEKIFSISVTDVNEAPTDISLTVSSIAENQSSGTTVGTLSATDPDAGDSHAYALVSGDGSTDNTSFSITGTSLKTLAVFDYETKNSYSIRVSATDSGTGSLTYEKIFAIGVTNANDAPFSYDQSLSTDEDVPLAITLTATDADNDALTYSIVNTPSSGTLMGSAPNITYTPNLNYYGADSFTFKAYDGAAFSNTATISIFVGDLTPPTTSATPVGGIYNSPQSVSLSCTDGAGSGCDKTYYCTGAGCSPTTIYNGASINISSSTVLRFYSTDLESNAETVKEEVYTLGDVGCTDGGAIGCVERLDGGTDADNLDSGKPKADIEYSFRIFVKESTGNAPQSIKLYMSQRASPGALDSYSYDMVCSGTDWVSGKTCAFDTKLGPAAAHKFYFEVKMSDGVTVRHPASGFLVGPSIKLLTGYNIVGAPRDINAAGLDGLSAFGSAETYRWVSDPAYPASGYYTFVNGTSPAIAGEGYFSKAATATIPGLDGYGEVAGPDYTYQLEAVWNLISNPYGGNIKLSDIMVKKDAETPVTWATATANGWLSPAIYYYNGSDWGKTYSFESAGGNPDAVLVPWVGYWIKLNMTDGIYYLVMPKP